MVIRSSLWPVFLHNSAHSDTERAPLPGVLLYCSVHQAHRGAPLVGVLICSSVHQAFDGPASLLFSCQCWHVVGREAMVMAPPPKRDSAVSPCFHGCLAFLHLHFPLESPPSHPLNPSLRSQQQRLPWDCSTIPKLQLPAAAPSRRPAFLSRVCVTVARTV